MRQYPLLAVAILAAACGPAAPNTGPFDHTLWRLSSVNGAPLPAPSRAEGQTWVAAVLQFQSRTGAFDRCLQQTASASPASRSTYLIIASVGDNRVTVSYFDQRFTVPDTAVIRGGTLTLRYTGVDTLTFVPLAGELPPACSLAP
jgi:hypothetical protein